MDTKLIVLKLFLDALDIKDKIETVDDRKRVQKAIYLGQLGGVDLGYRFGWYLMGPYCPSLTKDYYALAGELAARSTDYKGKSLKDSVKNSLSSIAPLLRSPGDIELAQENWLELLASTHFLLTISGLDYNSAHEALRQKKPHVERYFEKAVATLKSHTLLH